MKKRVLSVILLVVLLISILSFPVFAQDYTTDYDRIGNSGSPVWVTCNIQGYGWFVIVLPATLDIYSFGFDAPTGYNLINNTASTINGKAYKVLDSNVQYLCRWGSYDQLYFYVPYSSSSGYHYVPVTITEISATTLCPIDYVSDRTNDRLIWKYYFDKYWSVAVVVFLGVIAGIYVFKAVKRGF